MNSADLNSYDVCEWLFFSHLTLILLSQVLQNLGKEKFPSQSFEQVGTRIAKVLEKVLHGVFVLRM